MGCWEDQGKTVQDVNRMSAWSCGCDPGCSDYRCEHYPDCVGGRLIINQRIIVSAPKGLGGAPTRATTLPTDPAERKKYPIATGVLDYFPDAIAAIANVSWIGNEQHNPGMPLHWDRSKSADEADTAMRHFAERGTRDKDGARHTAKFAWRALALLQKEIEAEREQ